LGRLLPQVMYFLDDEVIPNLWYIYRYDY
jgi:hypothetical protein